MSPLNQNFMLVAGCSCRINVHPDVQCNLFEDTSKFINLFNFNSSQLNVYKIILRKQYLNIQIDLHSEDDPELQTNAILQPKKHCALYFIFFLIFRLHLFICFVSCICS
jgi:hypothetical protein